MVNEHRIQGYVEKVLLFSVSFYVENVAGLGLVLFNVGGDLQLLLVNCIGTLLVLELILHIFQWLNFPQSYFLILRA